MARKTAIDFLEKALKTYKERNKTYGDNYFKFGRVMKELFPDGITLTTEADFNRFGCLVQIVSKISRYANSFKEGGHKDSAHDLGVYAFIQEELDEFYKDNKK
jgi:hypothetical protein|tara:strand:+ start:80 stop:388 length:309 start_codon:yes stop_codon:yes gene_type:complete